MVEVYCDDVSARWLFMSEENAKLWIARQTDSRKYGIKPYIQQ